ncbi:MAG: S41 family peptidase [Muribaculaceae bacterium]|nr:S41 family peptidase [Muribaculaceae bacterium]
MKKILLILTLAWGAMAAAYAQFMDDEFTPDMKLRMANAIIERYYVEDVNADTVVEEAIKAMLKTLDPHSAYSNPEETKELNTPLEGKFSGIGIQFNMSTDTVYVIQTISGGPSEKVGIRPGDRIISADDTILAGRKLPNSRVMKALRGDKGSRVRLKVKRSGVPELIDFTVVRDDIPVYSVDASFMVAPEVGYIAVTRFAEETPNEVMKAVQKLKKQGMKRLIIDLNDNGGGYLGAAYGMAELFLPKGTPVLSTRGLNSYPMEYDTEQAGPFQDIPLVVMVNQYSASSSEIFAGAIQDNDRGVIVGRRTFGKGLVQRPFPFPDGSMIRLTTARYYIPSGRCVQKPYEKGHTEEYYLDMLNRLNSGELWSADSVHLDSTQVYHTLRNHRTVYGGGGVMPDVFVPIDTTYFSPYYRDLVAKGSLNTAVLNYVDHNRKTLNKRYRTPEEFLNGFTDTAALEKELIAQGEKDGTPFDEEGWERCRPYVTAALRGLILRDLFEDGAFSQATLMFEPIAREALEIINNPARYNLLLTTGEDEKVRTAAEKPASE